MNIIIVILFILLMFGLTTALISMLLNTPMLCPITRYYYIKYLNWLKSKGFNIRDSDYP